MNTTQLPTPFKTLSITENITLNQIMLLFVVGIVCGIVGILYVQSIRLAKKFFNISEKHINFLFIPVIGATIATTLGAIFPIVVGSNDLSRVLIKSPVLPFIAIGTVIAKIIATAAADGSKMAGGTVGPAILLGGLIGKLIGGFNPLFATAGSAAIIGPIAGIPLTMLLTSITWLGFTPLALIIIFPIIISKVICWGTELYPYIPPVTKTWPKELN